MKKSFLLLASVLVLASSATAQTNDLESLYKSGKAAFAAYDKDLPALQMKQKIDTAAFIANLKKGFADFEAALPLDSVKQVNKDGTPKMDKKTGLQQVKTKYSKEMSSTMAAHISDLANAASIYFDSQKYQQAAEMYDKYCTMIKSPLAIENKVVQPADSVLGQFRFLEGYCYYFTNQKKAAYPCLDKALKLGLTKPFGIDLAAMKADCFAQFLQDKLDSKDYDGAYAMLEKESAEAPTNGIYPYFKGIVMTNDSTKSLDDQLACFKKAMELDPKFGDSYFYAGNIVRQQVQDYMNANEKASASELAPKVVPMLNEALGYFEKAKENNSTSNADAYIENLKYALNQFETAATSKPVPSSTATTTTTTPSKKASKSKRK